MGVKLKSRATNPRRKTLYLDIHDGGKGGLNMSNLISSSTEGRTRSLKASESDFCQAGVPPLLAGNLLREESGPSALLCIDSFAWAPHSNVGALFSDFNYSEMQPAGRIQHFPQGSRWQIPTHLRSLPRAPLEMNDAPLLAVHPHQFDRLA